MLHDNFIEYGRSGTVWKKEDYLSDSQGIGDIDIQSSDFVLQKIGQYSCLLRYLTIDKTATTKTRRTSLWIRENGRWQLLFHEGHDLPL